MGLGLLAWVLVVYRLGWTDVPRGDQLLFLRERDLFPSDWGWFWHCVSFSRTRLLIGEAPYLFRPLHLALLALIEVAWRDEPLGLGLWSLLLHAGVSFGMYRLVGARLGPLCGALASVAFATQYAGMEMVTWRHIAPYMLGLLGVGLGASRWLAADPQGPAPRLTLAGGLLLGALAHETLVVAVLGTALVLAAVRPRVAGFLPVASVALAAWATLDLVDLLLHPVAAMPDPAAKVQEGFTLGVAARSALDMLGAGVVASAQPGLVDLRWAGMFGHFDRLGWDFSVLPAWALHVAGAIGLAPLAGAAVFGLRWSRAGDRRGPVVLLLVAETVALLVGFTAVRSAFRAFTYLQSATYYFYFFDFLFLATAAVVVSGFAWVQARLDRVALVLGGLALARGLPAYAQVQATLGQHAAFVEVASELARALRGALPSSGPGCYAGTFDPLVAAFQPPANDGPLVMVADVSCDVRGGEPRYLWRRADASFVLGGLPPVQGAPVALSGDGFVAERGGVTHPGIADGGAWSAFSASAFHATDVSLEVDHPASGGVWLGFVSPEDYTSVTIHEGRGLVVERHTPKGSAAPLRIQTAMVHDHVSLRFLQVGDGVQVVVDGVALARVPGASLEGRVGVFHHAPGASGPQVFRDLRVSEGGRAVELVAQEGIELPLLTAVARSTR